MLLAKICQINMTVYNIVSLFHFCRSVFFFLALLKKKQIKNLIANSIFSFKKKVKNKPGLR